MNLLWLSLSTDTDRRFHLALVDRVDSRPDDLAHVCALVDAEGQDGGEHGTVEIEEPEVQRRRDEREPEENVDAEVDEVDLDEHGRASEEEHVEPGKPAQRRNPRWRGDWGGLLGDRCGLLVREGGSGLQAGLGGSGCGGLRRCGPGVLRDERAW